MGEKKQLKKTFIWQTVILNLPSGKKYVPLDPWVSKDREDGNVESDMFIYLDDVR